MWFVYDPGEPEFETYLTEEEAKTALKAIINRYEQEAIYAGWDKMVERACMGRVTHRVDLVDVTDDVLPDLIEDGAASEGDEFAEAFIEEVPT